jgi:putative transposase
MNKGTTSYHIKDENALYFLTCATVEWIDVFTKSKYKEVFTESINFCIKNKGLEVFAWVLMTNHFHMIARAKEDFELSGILRDMKKHTTKEVVRLIKEEPEGRESSLLNEMSAAAKRNSKKQTYQMWRNDNHPIELFKTETVAQKLQYIHMNPVEEGIVIYPEDYAYSSAIDYSGRKGMIDIELING